MLTTVNTAPMVRFCASVVCSPTTGKIIIVRHDGDAVADDHVGDGLYQRHETRLFHAAVLRFHAGSGLASMLVVAVGAVSSSLSRSVLTCAKVRPSPSRIASRPVSVSTAEQKPTKGGVRP